MATEIQNFYKNKKIFLTGGTGFLGKVFIEKILRATDVDRIYVLIRPKRDKDIQTRIDDIFKDPLFRKLQSIKPHPTQFVTGVSGNCELNNLGLSDEDHNMIVENVHIIVHSAATVRFNEPLSNAIQVNVRATMDIIDLAKKTKNLQALIYVSSAFANCFEFHIEETFYCDKIALTAEKACKLSNLLGPMQTNVIAPLLHKQFPNTYCFTKALAEEAIRSHAGDLPVCVFRPGIILPTCTEPVSGWIDNLYGPTSILYGVAFGVLRVMYVYIERNANIVPVDFCANMMAVCAWKMAKISRTNNTPPPIYNLIPDRTNTLSWAQYKSTIEEHGVHMPITKMIWKPFLICTSSKFLYTAYTFFLHTIPGYLIDFVFLFLGKKRRMVKTYQRIHSTAKFLEYFVKNEWTFSMNNTHALWHSLSAADQHLFNFNMMSINWKEYFFNSLIGMRLYLAKEEPTTIPKAKILLKRLDLVHHVVRLIFFVLILLILYWCIFKFFV